GGFGRGLVGSRFRVRGGLGRGGGIRRFLVEGSLCGGGLLGGLLLGGEILLRRLLVGFRLQFFRTCPCEGLAVRLGLRLNLIDGFLSRGLLGQRFIRLLLELGNL